MSLKAFLADSIVSDGNVITAKALLVENGRVKALCHYPEIPSEAEKIPLPGLTLSAGLVDLQVNGGGGVLFNEDCTLKGVETIAAAHRAAGTTSILPTLISDDADKTLAALGVARECATKKSAGILGIHLEGPYLNPARSGIHEKNIIARANIVLLEQQNFSGIGKCLITLAPEMFSNGGIMKLLAAGVVISAGHSAATKDQLKTAKSEGLTGITHLFNAMGGMSARDAGLSGLALIDDALTCSIIADGAHVAPEMLRLAHKVKPAGKLFFVSDAMPPAGQKPPQPFTLQGKQIHADGAKCVDEQGNLAGSASTLFECVRYAVQHAGFKPIDALAMASSYPAAFMKLENEVGSLREGCRADIIAFDRSMTLHHVYMGGELVG